MVCICCSIKPPNFFCIPASSAGTATDASTARCSTIFIAPATSVFSVAARIFQAGIPASASCRISSACTLPLAIICPSAVVMRSMPSFPLPSAAAAFPIDRRDGIT